MPDDYKIPLSDCVRGNAYLIQSRNLILGVYDGRNGFVGIREKFGSEFLFTEYYNDGTNQLGTVTPFEDLGPCPVEDLSERLRQEWKGDGTDPEWATEGKQYFVHNEPLFEWLRVKEVDVAQICQGCGEPFWPLPWNNDGFCTRTACWDARRTPCETCGELSINDGTCERCQDPLLYDLRYIEARKRVDEYQAQARQRRKEAT